MTASQLAAVDTVLRFAEVPSVFTVPPIARALFVKALYGFHVALILSYYVDIISLYFISMFHSTN